MGLDTTHNAWHGSYSGFMRWRMEVAKAAGFPPLKHMVGFCTTEEAHEAGLLAPIPWDDFKENPLSLLLNHSDCDGELLAEDCPAIADALEALLPKLSDQYNIQKTEQFIAGLRLAGSLDEDIQFH